MSKDNISENTAAKAFFYLILSLTQSEDKELIKLSLNLIKESSKLFNTPTQKEFKNIIKERIK